MITVGVSMVKDEADIIRTTLEHMATQVDAIIIADNMSTDGTFDILVDVADTNETPILVLNDDVVAYDQSAKMTRLADIARRQFEAEWIVPFDADELWSRRDGRRIADGFDWPGQSVVGADLFDHVATGFDDSRDPNPVSRLGWRRPKPAPLPKVACRADPKLTIGMGNHEVSYDRKGHPARIDSVELVVHHYPNRSAEQLIRKVRNGAAAYAASDMPEMYGAHWRQWGRLLDEQGEEAIELLFHTWYFRENPTVEIELGGERQDALVHDPQRVHA